VDGGPAGGAVVRAFVEGELVGMGRSLADGAFRVEILGEGEVVLQATSGDLASVPIGPIPLGEGEELAGLTLKLGKPSGLSGRVLDRKTRMPIEGAILTVAGIGTITDHDGAFRVRGLPRGPITLRLSAPGYGPRDLPLSLSPGPTPAMEFFLTKGGRLRGVVLNEDGDRVAGVRVMPVDATNPHAPSMAGGVSGTDGSFEIDAPAGNVFVRAFGLEGREARSETLRLAAGELREGVEVPFQGIATLKGVVVDEEGEPVGGAVVKAFFEEQLLDELLTDAEGRFSMERIEASGLQLVASKEGRRGIEGPFSVMPWEDLEVSIRLGSGAFTGQVVDLAGRGIPGATVTVWSEPAARLDSHSTTSDQEGRFAIEGVRAKGTVWVEARAGDLRGEGTYLSREDVKVLLSGGSVAGVVRQGGTPVSDFRVAAAPTRSNSMGGPRSVDVVAADGRFRLELAPGGYEIAASSHGVSSRIAQVEVGEAGEVEVVLDLEGTGRIEGRAIHAETGQPIPDQQVQVSLPNALRLAGSTEITTITAEDGSFVLDDVVPGRVELKSAGRQYVSKLGQTFEVEAGRTTTAELRLDRWPFPITPPPKPMPSGGSGLAILMRSDKPTVTSVEKASPAFEAGIRRGDVLLSIDGTPVTGMAEVMKLLRGDTPGPSVALELQRGPRKFRVVSVRVRLND